MEETHDINYYRNEVLDAHLLLEDQVNTLLEAVFGIKLPSSFSNNYSKIDLLLELKLLDKEYLDGFQLISRIRNQFIHRLGVLRFTDLSKGLRKQLLAAGNEAYSEMENNEALFDCYKALFSHLMSDFQKRISEALQTNQQKAGEVKFKATLSTISRVMDEMSIEIEGFDKDKWLNRIVEMLNVEHGVIL